MIQDQLDGAAGRPGIKGCELDERRRIGRGRSRRPWLVQQAAFAQDAPPGKEAGFADLVALTKLTDGGLRLLPATDEFEPATLFGSIRMLGHEAPPSAPYYQPPQGAFIGRIRFVRLAALCDTDWRLTRGSV